MTNITINGKAPGHFIINMVTILGDGVRYLSLDDISFLCLNDDTLLYDGGSASIGRVRAALFFTEKNDVHTYLLDMFQYGRDVAGRKRKNGSNTSSLRNMSGTPSLPPQPSRKRSKKLTRKSRVYRGLDLISLSPPISQPPRRQPLSRT
ncbi:unnamed protein product [Hymenolepis diminuta]|uniref:Uncharacterized protein n=1 Tax=Hymenolepis diminuta TaxID=6216 RepID=A0A564XV22_HYMDI|nr:unnamed protein product [Hymenolepis diminuta]